MKNTIQEQEMHTTISFLGNYVSDIEKELASQTSIFRNVKTECLKKVAFENGEISFLNDQLNKCNENISFNENRIEEIEKTIKDLEKDIENCEEEIDGIEVPVYYWVYDDYGSYRAIDEDATESNRWAIARLRERISNDEESIETLKSEKEMREGFIKSLNQMIKDITACINSKKELIRKIEESIQNLEKGYNDLNKKFLECKVKMENLTKQVMKCLESIKGWGNTMSTLSYEGIKVSYSSNDVVSVSSSSMKDEISLLEANVMTNAEIIRMCAKNAVTLISNLKDNITEQTKEITTKSLNKLNKITKDYATYVATLKKALTYIETYESVKI